MFPDPLAAIDRRLASTLGGPVARRVSPSYQLTPEEEDSLIGRVGGNALSGISAVGNLLDVPGSMVRDLLGGQNPLDQLLSPLSSENRLTGRDLLRKHGMVGRQDTTGNWLGGLAAEIATDPLTLLTLGTGSALSAGGKGAKAAGLLANVAKTATAKAGKPVGKGVGMLTTSLDDLLRGGGIEASRAARQYAKSQGFKSLKEFRKAHGSEALSRGIAGFGLPFQNALFGSGTGKIAQGIAGGMDAIGAAAKTTAPVRFGRMLFDPAVQGKLGRLEQEVAEESYRAFPKAAAAAKTAYADAFDDMDQTYKAFDETFGDSLRGAGEATPPGSAFGVGDVVQAADRGNYGRVTRFTPEGAEVAFKNPETSAMASRVMSTDELTKAFTAGSPEADRFAYDAVRQVFDDVVRLTAETSGDAPRAMEKIMPGTSVAPEMAKRIAQTAEKMQAVNDSIYKAIELKGGNTRWIEGSDLFRHFPRKADQKAIDASVTTRDLPSSFSNMKARTEAIRTVPAKVVNDMLAEGKRGADDILRKYGEWLDPNMEGGIEAHAAQLAEWLSTHGKRTLFNRETLDDFLSYQMGAHRASKSIDAIHALFMRHAGDDGMELAAAFKAAKMDPERAVEHFAKLRGITPEAASSTMVPLDVVQAATAVNRVQDSLPWAKQIGEAIDGFTRVFKASVTLPFPSFLSRNFSSGQIVNLTTGLINNPAEIAGYSKAFREAVSVLRNPKEHRQLARELQIHGLIGNDTGFEGVDMFTDQVRGAMPANPLQGRQTLMESRQFVSANPSALDKLPQGQRMRVAGRTVAGTGAKANQNVEFVNRVPMYLYLKKQGWSPAAAAEKVKELHFDYSDLSPFEKNVAKRLVPFYTFTRKMAPLTAKTLIAKPGGAMAQTIRAANKGRDTEGMTPDYVAETLSIPLGQSPDGGNRYLTGFGMAHEDPLSFLGGGFRGAGLEALSRTNPLIKGPLEMATGQSFFQRGPLGGRPIDDLDPTIGRIMSNVTGQEKPVTFPGSQAVEAIAGNSPISRLLTTARQVSDPRKRSSVGAASGLAANLLTGARVSDISPGAQEAILRERLQQVMGTELGGRVFSRAYIPKDVREAMPPDERKEAERVMALMNLLAKRAKERKANK